MSPFGHSGRARVAAGALLLDVRSPSEFGERHIEGALNIPLQELSTRSAELGPSDRPIVVYCRSGARSAAAAAWLQAGGYDVLDIGGMENW